METLADYTGKTLLELQVQGALSSLDRHFFSAKKPRRFISGIAISSGEPNANGTSFISRGIEFSLPTPFLFNHLWERPMGRLIGLDTRGDQVHIKAEIANDMPWVDDIWQHMIVKNVARLSVKGLPLNRPIGQRMSHWRLIEVSACEDGADSGARITKCWETESVIYLDGRPSTKVHWSTQC